MLLNLNITLCKNICIAENNFFFRNVKGLFTFFQIKFFLMMKWDNRAEIDILTMSKLKKYIEFEDKYP